MMLPVRQLHQGEILSPAATVRVIGRTHPLAGERVVRDVAAGLSIAEILALCAGESYAGGFIVHINGHAVPPEHFRKVRVKAGATVTFMPRLQGGGNVWRTVLSAVIAVTALVVAPYLAPFLVPLGLSLGVATALVAGGIMLAGTLALNALFPVRPPQLGDNTASASLNSIQGAQNQAAPFGAVPVVLGRHRQSPFYAAKPYTEIVGEDQYLRLLFCPGYGPLAIDDLQIGETLLSSYSNYDIEVRQGLVSDAAVTLYPGTVDEVALSITLANGNDPAGSDTGTGGPWQSLTTPPDTDEISLDFVAPQGCYQVNSNSGNADEYRVTIKCQYRPVGTVSWFNMSDAVFNRSTSPIRRGVREVVARGQYEVRAKKQTGDGRDDKIKDEVAWTAIRSLKNAAPIGFAKPLALIALRIRASDQLSGVISTLNCITTSLVKAYSGAGNVWSDDTASQWPPDLFRHVLQGPANARPVADAGIDLGNLQEWWVYCVANGFKFNQVLTSAGSVYDKLADIAAAGRAVPTFINGKWGVIWDRPDDAIVQHFTPRNSWGFQLQHPYAQQPHGWRVSFINEDNGFTQDERIVYDDGYDATNATLFEGLQFPGVTDPDGIWKHGRFHIAQSRLRPEKISLNVGWEHLVCTRGDRVRVTHDVLLIGLAAARVKAVPGQTIMVDGIEVTLGAQEIVIDETVTIEAGKTYGMTFRVPDDVRTITRAVDAVMTAGDYTALTLVGDLSGIADGVLVAFGETDRASANYRVQGIAHQKDLIATLTLVDDAPEISQADQGEIPAYNPNVTIPADPFSLPPRDLQYLEVIDGYGASVRALVHLSWQLPRFGNVASFEVQQQDNDGGAAWVTVASVLPPNMSADVPIIAAGAWSFRVRCVFTNGTVSAWTALNGLALLGLSSVPGDIVNLHQHSVDGQTVLDWDDVTDHRLVYYEVRKGTSWDTGLVVGDVVTQPPWPTTGDGTYHVRAYVLSPFGVRIYSASTASIAIADSIISRNIIVSNDEQAAGWPGGLDGGVIAGSFIRTDVGAAISMPWAQEIVDQLSLDGLHIAVYLSSVIVDIGRAAECRFWTEYEASGVLQGEDFLAQPDVLGSGDILGTSPTRFIQAFPIWRFASSGTNDVFTPTDVFAPTDVFTADVVWGDFVAIASGTRVGRYFRAGLVLITNDATTDATGTKFSWFVDVPDRNDDYTELAVPNTGLEVTFYSGGYDATPAGGATPVPFNGGPNGSTVPHVQRAIINGSNGDEVKVTNLTLAGCTVHVVNAGSNVTRSGVNLLVRGF
ncbi:host specificity factor TipJ family phage tail protein [Bradyrhizobium sp. WSM1417]|uniref:host specificity factor TipJ family phage tail protein n=1 Tax=Bradyrhizobium sp. WSM1417 TaxID=754500 RepID=UPI0004832F47|nr:host specificity factor TipJ family phage tail protein [Bradyrhizobium sp. WSM1417]